MKIDPTIPHLAGGGILALLAVLSLANCGEKGQPLPHSPTPPAAALTTTAADDEGLISTLDDAVCLAIFNDPVAGMDPSTKASVATDRTWPQKKKLRIKFLNGTPKLQDRIRTAAMEWTQHINLTFDFGSHAESDVRIDTSINDYHRSSVGTDAEAVGEEFPTMWLGVAKLNDTKLRQVVLHEFGHMIGMRHEHQHPQSQIPWNEQKVYAYYKKFGGEWEDPSFVHYWVIRKDPSSNHAGSYDKNSIMHYAIPASITDGTWHAEWGTNLSQYDITFMSHIYPKS